MNYKCGPEIGQVKVMVNELTNCRRLYGIFISAELHIRDRILTITVEYRARDTITVTNTVVRYFKLHTMIACLQ